jgi:hypothetical protein
MKGKPSKKPAEADARLSSPELNVLLDPPDFLLGALFFCLVLEVP